jgi:hypothetical protein
MADRRRESLQADGFETRLNQMCAEKSGGLHVVQSEREGLRPSLRTYFKFMGIYVDIDFTS